MFAPANDAPAGSAGRSAVLQQDPPQTPPNGWVDDEIEKRWRRLAVERGNAFLLPEWFSTWMHHYGSGFDASIKLATGPDGTPFGLLPLVADRNRLRFAGGSLGDHFEPVAPAGDDERVASAIAAELSGRPYLVLDHIECGSGWPDAIAAASPRPLRALSSRRDVLPFIDIEGVSWEQYLGSRSRNFRSQVRRKMRALERDHAAVFRRTEKAADLDADLDALFELHDARWGERGGSGMASPTSRRFHRDFAAALLERGWLRLWVLELEGEPAAAWYGWNVGGRYAYYMGGFSPAWEDRSVGFVLLAHTIRSATEEGASEYDLLRGGEEYKTRFATGVREVETVVLVGAASLARLRVAAEAGLWSLSRNLPPRARRLGSRLYRRLGSSSPTDNSR